MKTGFSRGAAALAAGPLLFACGGGNDTVAPMQEAATPVVVVGPITGFGSIVVNGMRLDDAAAAITIDDAVQTRDRLRVGMMVQVRGRVRADGSAVADVIEQRDCMEGPITAMNRVRNTIEVLGQTVQLDDQTVFDGVTVRDMNAFAIGDLVQVSCEPDTAHNRVQATRIERKRVYASGTDTAEVKGQVSALDVANGTCMVGRLVVNFAGIPAGQLPAGLANGMTIEASGKAFNGNVLTADRLRDRDRDRMSWPNGAAVEVEGYVTDFVTLSNFKVDGRVVDASKAVIRNGTSADVGNGTRVEAEGSMVGDVLVAARLVLKPALSIQVQAPLQGKDAGASTLTLLGKPIAVNAETVLIDRTGTFAQQPRVIALSALAAGDRLEVKGWRGTSGVLTAAWVERTDPDPLVVVKGPADAKVPVTQVTLGGFSVATSTNTRYRNADGTLVDAATFYTAIAVAPAPATVVHARGVVADLAATVVDATRSASSTGELEVADPAVN